MKLLGLVLVVVTIVGIMPALIRQYRTDREGFWKTLRVLCVYLAFLAVVVSATLWLLSGERPSVARALAAGIFGLAGVLYGALWLTRLVPRYRSLPGFIDRFPGGLDYAFWTVLLVSLAAALLA